MKLWSRRRSVEIYRHKWVLRRRRQQSLTLHLPALPLCFDQPPQLKPMIMVTTAPATAPWTRRLNEWSCRIEGSGMICPSVK
jgi:hypothetical protein